MFARVGTGTPSLKQLQETQAQKFDEFCIQECDENIDELQSELTEIVKECAVIDENNFYYMQHKMERESLENKINGIDTATSTSGKPAGFRRVQ